jgi:hypothetical protein
MNQRRMLFVTGASRSGTTLLSFVLRNHRAVHGLRELQYFGECWDPAHGARRFSREEATDVAARLLARQQHGIMAGRVDAAHLSQAAALVDALGEQAADPARLYAATVHWLSQSAGKSVPCEQTPRYVFYAERLLDLYPNARIVHMVRDPRAVMASQKMRWKRRALAAEGVRIPRYESLRVWINYHPYTVSQLWCRATTAALALAEHPRVTLLRFEDLVSDPEATVRQLCSRLELDYDDSLLDVPQINSSHRSARYGARRGLRPDAMDTWRETLDAAEQRIAERRCGDLMQRFGYGRVQPREGVAVSELRYRMSYAAHLCGVALVNPRRARTQLSALRRAARRSGALALPGPEAA